MDNKPTKLRKVKTIRKTIDWAESFDKEVNNALADGWYLVKRCTVPSYHDCVHIMLVAELQRYDDYDE